MADADEDAIRVSPEDGDDIDPTDEVQDFSLLRKPKSQKSLPKRGEKSFEPHGTSLQTSRLSSSRAAMHDQLAVGRTHNPKAHILAVYDTATNGAVVDKPRGQHFLTMGRVREGRLWLWPEEALYLLERGSLDVRWPVVEGEEEGVPMSLQGAYAAFIGMEGEEEEGWRLTLEKYNVYAGLKKAGYTVLRAEGHSGHVEVPAVSVEQRGWGQWFFAEVWRRLFEGQKTCPPERLALGPLVAPGLYRSYNDVYRLLQLIPFHNPTVPQSKPNNPSSVPQPSTSRLRVTYHVHKPSPTFKKSDPGPPDFRICVIDARTTLLPTLSELSTLLESTPYDPPAQAGAGAQLYNKLKHGYRNVVLAVVDQGVTSYVRVADAGFGMERVYERGARGGGKRGGFRGRGRGRGRG